MGLLEDWFIPKYSCPVCFSNNVEKTVFHKQAYDLKKGHRREFTKYICNECKHTFWK